jgi:hypothetical protein
MPWAAGVRRIITKRDGPLPAFDGAVKIPAHPAGLSRPVSVTAAGPDAAAVLVKA